MKNLKLALVAVMATAFTATVQAAIDFTTITGAVDLSGVETAIAAIGAILAGFYVARKGLYMVLSMLRSKG